MWARVLASPSQSSGHRRNVFNITYFHKTTKCWKIFRGVEASFLKVCYSAEVLAETGQQNMLQEEEVVSYASLLWSSERGTTAFIQQRPS